MDIFFFKTKIKVIPIFEIFLFYNILSQFSQIIIKELLIFALKYLSHKILNASPFDFTISSTKKIINKKWQTFEKKNKSKPSV
ncbi:unnamed protein product, partial [Vitis vinifera]